MYKKNKGSKDGALGYTTICIACFRCAWVDTYYYGSVFQISEVNKEPIIPICLILKS